MRVSERELMLYFDGELDRRRAEAIAFARSQDPSLDARLARLARLGELTRRWARRHGVARTERAVVAAPSPRISRGLAMLALAAAALVVVVRPDDATPSSGSGAAVRGEAPASVLPAVAVESVDFGARSGIVLHVPAADGPTTVVWLSEETPPAGARPL